MQTFAHDLELVFAVLHGTIVEDSKEIAETNVVVVDTMEKVDTLISYIKITGYASFDMEDAMGGKPTLAGLAESGKVSAAAALSTNSQSQ